jgi:hypothetical protein
MASQSTSVEFLPGLLDGLERLEARWIAPPRNPLLRVPHVLTGGLRMTIARWRMRVEVQRSMRRAQTSGSALMAAHAERLAKVAQTYARKRFEAGRRITEYQVYAKLFSLWHVLHIPLFFMLLIAGIVHVVAINIY